MITTSWYVASYLSKQSQLGDTRLISQLASLTAFLQNGLPILYWPHVVSIFMHLLHECKSPCISPQYYQNTK